MRALIIVSLAVSPYILAAQAAQSFTTQPTDPTLKFEVASVKPNVLGSQSSLIQFQNGRYVARYVTLKRLIRSAYGTVGGPLSDSQIVGRPDWLDRETFDVEATAPGTASAANGTIPPAVLMMLRNLLEERVSLQSHVETRERPLFALVRARQDGALGPGLSRATITCTPASRGIAPKPDGPTCGGRTGYGMLAATGITMPVLANGLAQMVPEVGRMVVDKTGLLGTFDVALRWTPESAATSRVGGAALAPRDYKHPSLFVAIEEQLGLKLERTTGPVDVVVIDRVEPLKPN
jgi:uncharacterized protein (TIGR03435 family)